MSDTQRRLLELWTPPDGFRLASVLTTTYECQADFLEEDLLPVALGMRLTAARGRDFRLELEQALRDVEVTVYLHPDRYQPGRRRTPRVDLVPCHEKRIPKLHAKVSLLRFVDEAGPQPARSIVRLIVGSANLTGAGYRSNIEVATALDDAPDADPSAATAVRDAVSWLRSLTSRPTEQARRQLRDLEAVFAARPVEPRREGFRFVGLPRGGGLFGSIPPGPPVETVTLVSPFWPEGEQPGDVAQALLDACGRVPRRVRLLGPAHVLEDARVLPVVPSALVSTLLGAGCEVQVAAANPGLGCVPRANDDEAAEFDALARRVPVGDAHRELHAKMLLLEGGGQARLAVGSFNFTRRGLGLHGRGNTEAGLVWVLNGADAGAASELVEIGTGWRTVGDEPEGLVWEPGKRDDGDGRCWPSFLFALRARRCTLQVEGDGGAWPSEVRIRMRDIRGRLTGQEQWFDPLTVKAPAQDGVFEVEIPLRASWMEAVGDEVRPPYALLPDLEAEVSWDGRTAVVPVLFVDKHEFPVVERARRDDERALIDWFLGLRPDGEGDGDGFGHAVDPLEGEDAGAGSPTSDILSYLVRDFVHALPGMRSHLADAAVTETGMRSALLGPRSPVALAREIAHGLARPAPGSPRKTLVATAFQLAEILDLVRTAELHELPDGATGELRREAVQQVRVHLLEVVRDLDPSDRTPLLQRYLERMGGNDAAT